MFRLISTVIKTDQTALVTLPERMQRVHAYTLQGEPLTTAFTLLMLGFHVLLDLLCERDTLIPNFTSLPQKSHFAIESTPPLVNGLKYPSVNQQKT